MVRIFSEPNCLKFTNQVQSINWDNLFLNQSEWYKTFITKVRQIFEVSFPFKKLSKKRSKDKPWITKGIKVSIKQKKSIT